MDIHGRKEDIEWGDEECADVWEYMAKANGWQRRQALVKLAITPLGRGMRHVATLMYDVTHRRSDVCICTRSWAFR